MSADGTTTFYNVPKRDSEMVDDDVTTNLPKFIGDAAENSADNANGNTVGSTPPITGYQGR